ESKANYSKLTKGAKILTSFTDIYNELSMLHIDNVSEFIRLIIKNEDNGIFFTQNKEYVKTSEIVKIIAEVHERRIYLTKIFNPILNRMINNLDFVNKIFGIIVYNQAINIYKESYHNKDLYELI